MKIIDEKSGNLIFETDEKIDIYEHLIINGRHYLSGTIKYATNEILVEEFEPDNREIEFSEDFICPFCGNIDSGAWEHDTDADEVICGFCGSILEYQKHIEITYSVKLKNKPPVKILS